MKPENSVGKICPYCQSPIKPDSDVIVCPECGIAHHASCWKENDGCTTYGCTGEHVEDTEEEYWREKVVPETSVTIAESKYKRAFNITAIIMVVVMLLLIIFTNSCEKEESAVEEYTSQAEWTLHNT